MDGRYQTRKDGRSKVGKERTKAVGRYGVTSSCGRKRGASLGWWCACASRRKVVSGLVCVLSHSNTFGGSCF